MSGEDQSQQQRSLYRRHRPRTFHEVVGQEPVVRTLSHAVQRGKVHHAYLFVGSRGTGKTSMAKILAACLNCESGPTIEPCGTCDSCRSIAAASSLDVIEMDAASNNSVDDIRELRESVAYAPVSGRRKVYILDEAHMLSTAAWNAFLKTLEEPPPNTVFVLATTEAGKVPATVVDRCHRFDFHRPTVEQIASVVRRAAAAEAIDIPPPAVAALARSATGSFRDALGTLEQLVTYSGSQIALEDVLAVLGVADSRLLEETVDAVHAGEPARAIRALEACVEQGRDAASFASDLEVRARELLVVQTLGEVPGELALTPEADSSLLAQAERVDHATVVRLLELLGEAMEGVRAGADARTRLELALVKAARPALDPSMRALLARIERLESERSSGPPATGASGTPPAGATARPPVTAVPGSPPAGATPPPATAAASPPADALASPPSASSTPSASAPPATGAASAPAQALASPPSPASAPPGPHAPPTAVPDMPRETPGSSSREREQEQVAEVALGGDLASMSSTWPAVIELVRGENALLAAVIAEARPVALDGEDLTLAFASTAPFLKKKAEDPANRTIVGEALRAITSRRMRLSYELRDDLQEEQRADGGERSEEDWIRRFVEEFDAEEIDGEWEPAAAAPTRAGEHGARAVNSNEKGS